MSLKRNRQRESAPCQSRKQSVRGSIRWRCRRSSSGRKLSTYYPCLACHERSFACHRSDGRCAAAPCRRRHSRCNRSDQLTFPRYQSREFVLPSVPPAVTYTFPWYRRSRVHVLSRVASVHPVVQLWGVVVKLAHLCCFSLGDARAFRGLNFPHC